MKLKLDMSCHLLNAYTKFQIDISKHVEKKSGKLGRTDGRTDGQTDGHCHSIIRPFFKRAYKNGLLGKLNKTKGQWQLLNKTNMLNETRQIWGIWKLRPAYSPEMPNLGQNRWCFVPCDLEIWWITLENNRASLLCCFKLCATFHSHWWIQTGFTVRKRSIWVKFDDF